MEPYNPIARIREEVDTQTAITALALCSQFFMASTIEDFRSVILQINTVLKEKPQPIDPLEFLYKTLLSEAHERILVLKAAELWGKESDFQSQAIAIEPVGWEITLKTGDSYRGVKAEKDINYQEYENPSIIVTPENGSGKTIVIDIEAIIDLYKA